MKKYKVNRGEQHTPHRVRSWHLAPREQSCLILRQFLGIQFNSLLLKTQRPRYVWIHEHPSCNHYHHECCYETLNGLNRMENGGFKDRRVDERRT